ncbi:DUF3857 domain-containing protein [Desertivirga arenae]|uniref:DUF3857 domain-containing protein n=1 Tax=Desertivirga arenae TaxID=2810309 RepID=UPI001A9710F9|nr:DUF3857 domain-containing transglutaminase family protein [Pedobacter sp. SYSU D00823]
MNIKIIFLSLILLGSKAFAQTNYAVSSIPKNLLIKAGAVVRAYDEEIRVNDLTDVVYHTKFAVTILNESGRSEGRMRFYYDKISQIKSIKGSIYNEFGLPVGKFGEKNFQDQSISDYSLYLDDRVKHYNPAVTTYPYTIEYEVEIKTKQSLFFPSWVPVNSTAVSLEKSSLKFICPIDFKLRFKEYCFSGKHSETTEGNTKMLSWEINNIAALRDEPYSPDYDKFLPMVKLAPENFAYKGIKGSFSNWAEYGRWMSETLLKGRDVLTEQTRQEILELIKNAVTPKEKAKLVYQYMQKKTRYISVQIGIGGYQPFPAAEVDRLGYGDCKGLVNYTKALLNVAGIESYYCVVYAGSFRRNIEDSFTSLNQGNHVILCLPFKSDTTWLECTSQHSPFGFLGDFTDDRVVLACTPEGGKLMRTPKMETKENAQIRTAELTISAQGAVTGKLTTQFSGAQYDNHDELLNEPYEEQVKKIGDLYPKLTFQTTQLQYKKLEDPKPSTIENLSFISNDYCSLVDGKLLLPINKLNVFDRVPKEVRNRLNAVYINRSWYDEDLITFNLPENYNTTFPAEKRIVDKAFGKYTCDISYSGNKIIYKRTLQLNDGTYPAEQYADLVNFFQEIHELDTGIITLVRR